MRKTSKTARITILLLVLCLISTAMLSGTFAKYTSEYAGADTALIAKWDVTVKEGTTEFSVSPAVANLDLFSHAYDTDINQVDGEDYIIAPGVSGDFVLNVANTGDVAAKMTFDFTVSGTETVYTVPIEYRLAKVGQGDEEGWDDLAALKTALEAKMQNVAAGTGEAEETVEWRWPYEASGEVYDGSTDLTDTALGTDSVTNNHSTYILTIKATATQIQPTIE